MQRHPKQLLVGSSHVVRRHLLKIAWCNTLRQRHMGCPVRLACVEDQIAHIPRTKTSGGGAANCYGSLRGKRQLFCFYMIQTTLKATTEKMTAGLETTQAADVQKAGVTMETMCEEEFIEVDGEGVVSQGGKSAAELLLTALQNMDASQAQALVVANMAQFNSDATVPDVFLSQDTDDSDLSSLAEGSLTPIIKEELKYTIQTKRLASGLDELDVEEIKNSNKAKKPRKMSPEEVERRRVRRERNRIAAAKCRNKKRERGELLQEESERLESQNERLKLEISRLQDEKEKIDYLLQFHRPTCIMKAPVTTCAPVTTTSKPTAVMVDSVFTTASSSDLSWDSAETVGQEPSPSPAIVPVDLSCAYSSDSDSDTELS